MKFDSGNSAMSSKRRKQIRTAVLVTSIAAALGIGIFITSPIVDAARFSERTTRLLHCDQR